MRILNPKQESLLLVERKILNELQLLLVQFGADVDDSQALSNAIIQLDDLFLLVVVGEFNSGKSAFINALIGKKLLKEGVTPTTTQINLLRYGSSQEQQLFNENQVILTLPVEWLTDISIVDTPGTNAIIREHERITSHFIPRSDLVLFITSVDRPFTESERLFLEKIRDWGKKVVFVINKIDILENPNELEQIKNYVKENARNLLGLTPEIFPISSRLALRAKLGEQSLWEPSRFETLETFIHNNLDEKSRLKLKFLNPLGVALHLSDKYAQITQERLNLLATDIELVNDINGQLSLYKEDMLGNFNFRISDIEKILLEMEERGNEFFEETFRLARVMDLLNKERIRKEFEKRVIKDVPSLIENRVEGLIDWLVDSDLRQWRAINQYIIERGLTQYNKNIGEAISTGFHYNREHLIEAVGKEAQRVVDTYDKSVEAQNIAQGAQEAVAASAVLEVGAVSLGTLVAMLATTATADVTGVLLASLIAALGIFIIPAKRRFAKAEMKSKVGELRNLLVSTLTNQFKKEIERSVSRIDQAIAPYARFVRSEHSKLTEIQEKLTQLKIELQNLKMSLEEEQ